MVPEKLIAKCKSLKIIEERRREKDYYEIVIPAKDLEAWNSLLAQFFGPPSKAAGHEVSKESIDLTRNYGSLRNEQILFKKELEKFVCIAVLWMWKDGLHTTLKIASFGK
ncbi:MAG: hypothetical protein HQL27_04230 [Candidatus Omnitrophica bacterium]|nr:hypothetical protein [Candidatus Omnitrophota bacterium]